MKIVIVVHNLTGGGAERVAAMWAQGFGKRGYEVFVLIHDDKSPVTYTLPESVKMEVIVSHRKGRIFRTLERMLKLRAFVKSKNPQVVIDVMPKWWKIIAIKGLKCKKISTEHWSFERPQNAPVKPTKMKKIYLNRLYDHVTVLTQADKDVISNKLKHVTVLPNPLALEPATEIPMKQKMVLATGRLDAWYVKGFDILIKAWGRIALQCVGWKLQIAGGGSENCLSFLKNLCAEQNVSDSVEFVGFQSNILPYYQHSSVFVLSSRYEGFGLVLIEAMSQGCACVACDYKGRQKEIITSDDKGITCEPDNVDALSESILSLIQSEEKRKRIGFNAIARSQDFCIDKIIEKWESIFDKVL